MLLRLGFAAMGQVDGVGLGRPILPAGYHFDPHQWIPTAGAAVRGGVGVAGILVLGFLLCLALRRFIQRHRLMAALSTAIVTIALYVGMAAAEPDRLLDRTDYGTLWFSRLCAAALLFCAARLVDRMLIVPLLSRGSWRGELVPASRIMHQILNTAIVVVAVMTFGAMAFGWDINKFLEGSAVVSIVLGLALQETLGNFISGLVMHASQPFAVGDWVGLADVEGRVMDMSWRAVTVRTADDNEVIVPNGAIARERLVNYNRPTHAGARWIEVGLDYEIPPAVAGDVLRAAALETAGVLANPPPIALLQEFADSAMVYRLKFWIDRPAAHLTIEHQVRSNVWYRLKQKGLGIPFPVRVVEHVRLERKREQQEQRAIEERCRAISQVPLFQPLSAEQTQAVARGAADVLLGPGQVLFRQGQGGDSLYIIRRGEVEVLAEGADAAPARMATLRTGDFFGEMSALTGQPRSATIRALTDVCCVEICKADLGAMFAADPSIMEKMSQIVVDRNAARAAAMSELAESPATHTTGQQTSLLARMRSFFGFGLN